MQLLLKAWLFGQIHNLLGCPQGAQVWEAQFSGQSGIPCCQPVPLCQAVLRIGDTDSWKPFSLNILSVSAVCLYVHENKSKCQIDGISRRIDFFAAANGFCYISVWNCTWLWGCSLRQKLKQKKQILGDGFLLTSAFVDGWICNELKKGAQHVRTSLFLNITALVCNVPIRLWNPHPFEGLLNQGTGLDSHFLQHNKTETDCSCLNESSLQSLQPHSQTS